MKYDCKRLADELREALDTIQTVRDCAERYPCEAHNTADDYAARGAAAHSLVASFDAEPELWDDLLHAARAVVDNWSTGDLASAVRELAACVVAIDDGEEAAP